MTKIAASPSSVAGVEPVHQETTGTGRRSPKFASPTFGQHVSKLPAAIAPHLPTIVLPPIMPGDYLMLLSLLSTSVCCVYAFASVVMTAYWAWRVWGK
ncbi:hypothetical protein [Bremerella volcania]|uniref:hypothetical protein n=1 Tax=Bremerella volcania TaxID=2527984 RepID=UPI0011AB0977|nr:hypothetical protein [Bremerella volcania]